MRGSSSVRCRLYDKAAQLSSSLVQDKQAFRRRAHTDATNGATDSRSKRCNAALEEDDDLDECPSNSTPSARNGSGAYIIPAYSAGLSEDSVAEPHFTICLQSRTDMGGYQCLCRGILIPAAASKITAVRFVTPHATCFLVGADSSEDINILPAGFSKQLRHSIPWCAFKQSHHLPPRL